MYKLTKKDCIDIVCTAVESGIYYWADCPKYNPDAGTATIRDIGENSEETPRRYRLTPAIIRKAYAGLYASNTYAWSTQHAGDDIDLDSGDCDAIVQWACFNEVIYG